MPAPNLTRFLEAHNQSYQRALTEIKNGKKTSHWMWYIFPQLQGLANSDTARFYAINNLEEAEGFLQHPVLGKHLIEISEAVLVIEGKTANKIFGKPDDRKLRSCMTLFANVKDSHPVFREVLEKYYDAEEDERTVEFLNL
ncbi:DUF1810 domain-containing protein [Flavobacterium sp.]|uniref:DUF1810 domain-containing protein n=1 Tax=Flavobacterium sp. TaxID=239 RepID=UPI0025E3C051|nr:DUF1810 domain-containing protein [Flavobacterium sp.]